MRLATILVLATSALLAAAVAQAGDLSPALQAQLDAARNAEPISVIVHLTEQAPITAISRDLDQRKARMARRHEEIVRALKDASRSQEPLLADLATARTRGDVLGYTRYWIANLVVVRGHAGRDPADLAARADVAVGRAELHARADRAGRDSRRQPPEAARPRARSGVTPGHRAPSTPPRCGTELGIRRRAARSSANLDTGVDGNHPALAARWRGNVAPAGGVLARRARQPAPRSPSTTTATAPTPWARSCGLGAASDTIGVAPGAEWIAANAIDQGVGSEFDNDVIDCFQWFADPDGDPTTIDDVPDVVQNSWGMNESFGRGYNDCDTRWWAAIDNCEAAGVVRDLVRRQRGPGRGTLRSPADRADHRLQLLLGRRGRRDQLQLPLPDRELLEPRSDRLPTAPAERRSSPRSRRPASTSTARATAAATAT